MTIAQALKEKNKKVAKLSRIWTKLSSYNSILEGSERPYSIDDLWNQYNAEIESLVDIKAKIHVASAPVRKNIFMLSELKSKITNIKSLNTTNGITNDRFHREEKTQMVAHFKIEWKDSAIEKIEAAIDSIQESLDAFNHTVHI